MTKIHFISDNDTLAGHIFRANMPGNLAFLFLQGWLGHQNIQAAQRLAELGFTSMTYDMRGNGESEGDISTFSRADYLSDAVIAYDYLKRQVGGDIKIGVIGSSFGSYLATLLSAQRDVRCLSLRVPASYPDKGFDDPHLPQADSKTLRPWRIKALSYDNRAFQALHNFRGAVQIIEAGTDEIVPHQAPQNYAKTVSDQSKLTYCVMKNAPHSLVNDGLQKEYERLLTSWVRSLDGTK